MLMVCLKPFNSPKKGLVTLQECKLMALRQMVQRFAQIVDRVTWVTPESPQDDDAVNAVATLYHNKAHGMAVLHE